MNRFVCVSFVCLLVSAAFGAGSYDGGSGVAGDPYRIATAEQIVELGQDPNDWDKCFVLTADIDMDPDLLGEGVEVLPVGGADTPFSGVFDGGGHVISNLTMNLPDSDYVGLFGRVADNAEIKNLGLENATVSGKKNVGALAGFCSCKISQCFSRGVVNGTDYIGGLIGYVLGGNGVNVSDCYSNADVNGTGQCVSGFVGMTSRGEIIRCYSNGKVEGSNGYYSGGFLTTSPARRLTVSGCFWDVDTSGTIFPMMEDYGIVGLDAGSMKNSRFYSYCNWPGDVWTIDEGNDYPRLAWENKPGLPMPESGGFNGAGTEADPYKIETYADLRILSFDESLWDKHFVLKADLDLEGVFMTPIGCMASDPYFSPIPISRTFLGSFDGGGHVISNLSINLPDFSLVGLFSYIYDGGEIKNLGLENANISGGFYVGALAGENYGNVSGCYVTGGDGGTEFENSFINGVMYVGALAGYSEGNISRCFVARIVVDGVEYVGGGVGWNKYGSISDCYSDCSVIGMQNVGGFLGKLNEGSVSNCYSTGTVSDEYYTGGFVGRVYRGSVSNCFWDVESSGVDIPWEGDNFGAIGKSTSDMKNVSTFAGWDFVGGDSDGKMDVWYMPVGDYPRLFWEADAGDCDYDGVVGVGDLGVMGQWWLTCQDDLGVDERLLCDFDFDGVVGLGDFAVLAGNWLEDTGL